MHTSTPTPFDFFLYGNLVLCLIFWPIAVYAIYRTLPLTFGPEASAAWTGRRRLKMIGGAFVPGVVVCFVLFLTDQGTRLLDSIWHINPGRFTQWYDHNDNAVDFNTRVLGMAAFELGVALLALMGVKLNEKWGYGRLSEAERAGGGRAVRAWLGGANAFWAVAVTLCVTVTTAWMTDRNDGDTVALSAVVSLLLCGAVLLAFPVWHSLQRRARAEGPAMDAAEAGRPLTADLSPERQRVLTLLENGRVTADEAAELLSALAATATSVVPAAAPPAMTFPRKLVLAGAAAVLVAFFLPWFRMNPMAELQRTIGVPAEAMSAGMPQAMFGQMRVNGGPVPWPPAGQSIETAVLSVTGGDVDRGLGWLTLAAALCAAAAPAVTGLSVPARRQAAWLAAGVGTLLTLYLLSSGLRHVSVGLPLAVVGFAVQWTGLLLAMPRPLPSAAGAGAAAAA